MRTPRASVEPEGLDALLARWDRALGHERLRPRVAEGEHTGVTLVDWFDLDAADPALADDMLERALPNLLAGERVLQERAQGQRVHLRIRRLPTDVPIRDLRSKHLGRLIAIHGLVKRATVIRPRVMDAFWRCLRCDCLLQEPVTDPQVIREPLQCYHDQGGCGHSTGFRFDEDRSRKVNSQRLDVQESPDAMTGGEQPGRLTVTLLDDLCGQARPGDRVTINGVLRDVRKRKAGGLLEATSDYILLGVSVEQRQQAYEDVTVTPEEQAQIEALARRPDLFDVLPGSIAPSIYGMREEKLSVALQLFGGTERDHADGTRRRGDIHILLLGDPGVAKSQLLRAVSKLIPRAILASGRGSSGVGLTASVGKDSETDQWTVEAGALVLADRGLACIDELDKMGDDDRGAIHGALEQGVVLVNKANIVGLELNARASVLAAGNPKDGRFDLKFGTLADQVDLDPALLSRFDVIWLLVDRPNEARDRATMGHIVRHERRPEPTASLPAALLRKYIAHARRAPAPLVSDEAATRIEEFYVQLRKQAARPEDPIPATPRQGEAILRLAEAAARARLSPMVTPSDVDLAISLVETSLRRYALNPDGKIDIDKALTATSSTQRDAIHRIILIVDELERAANASPHGAHRLDVLAAALKQGIPNEGAERILDRLVTDGRLTKPRGDYYRRA